MIEDLRKNVKTEIAIFRELSAYAAKIDLTKGNEKKLILDTVDSLRKTLKIINKSLPAIIQKINVYRTLPGNNIDEIKNLEKVQVVREDSRMEVIVPKADRNKFLEELSISEGLIKKLKKRKIDTGDEIEEFKAARGYLKLANKFFLELASDMINRGKFRALYSEIKKSNLTILFETYVAMIFLSTLIAFFIGLALAIILIFFQISPESPFFSFATGNILGRIATYIWIVIALPIITFVSLYFYPSLEKSSIGAKIDRELPFAVIHMSAISGSGISPIEIFKIIGLSKEYPTLRKEIRKIMNQINLYGYDLVTALNNSVKNSPSQNLSELYSGLATTINSGGDLREFFSKRSETLLLSYRLEREKYSKLAETFMDIYISVVIAAPMVLMLLLVIISVSNIGFQFTQFQITVLIVTIISLINVVFLVFLHLKQPTY